MMVGGAAASKDYVAYVAANRDSLRPDADPERPNLVAVVKVTVRDRDGKVVKSLRFLSRSPTQNLVSVLAIGFTGNNLTYVNTSGTSYTVGGGQSTKYSLESTYIVEIAVGSGTGTPSGSDYNLFAPITNGTGAGQLQYGSLSFSGTYAVSGSTASFSVAQSFVNNSGGDVTITEVGIIEYVNLNIPNGSTTTPGDCLIWHDVLPSPITVGNGQTVTIEYTFYINP